MPLNVLIPARSPRLDYILDLLLGRWLGVDYRVTTSPDAYLNADGPRLHYGRERVHPQEMLIPAGGLLFETGIQPQVVQVTGENEAPFFFAEPVPAADLPFDFFALAFYCLSRYEEHLPFAPDAHGRFEAAESLAGRHNFLPFPQVDHWLEVLREKLNARFPGLTIPAPAYFFQPTYDVDLAWAYRHRNLRRALGGLARDLLHFDGRRIGERLTVWTGRRPDPYFTFPYLEEQHRQFQLEPVFFFLLADYGPHDRGIDPATPALRELIRQLAEEHVVGIHPSYRSNDEPARLTAERERLERITGRAVHRSRQHYLRLHLPQTYRRLIAAGITDDYTMGYASALGFRAGTARSFPWYDLVEEGPTSLTVHPFQVMDVALKQYLQLSPEQALAALEPLIDHIRRYGGDFRTLWHNSSFAKTEGWSDWKKLYEALLAIAAK